MAILERLRKRSGLLIAAITGLALLAFVLDDLLRSSDSLFRGSKTDILKIDNQTIPYQVYEAKVDKVMGFYKQHTGQNSIDEQTLYAIRDQVWEEMIQDFILEKETRALGLEVSEDELFDIIQGADPHPMVRQLFTNRETGIFERANLIGFLKNMDQYATEEQKTYWLYLEEQIEKERLRKKYNNLISKGIYITKYQAEKRFFEYSQKVAVNYVHIGLSSVSDSAAHVTNADLRKYYNANKRSFKQDEARDVLYVTFPIEPSEEDFKAAEKWINDIYDEFAATEDMRQFVNLNSDVPYDEKNYKQEELDTPLDSIMFAAKEGFTYGPYMSDGAFKIARLASVAMLPDSVHARHILIQPGQQRSEEQAKALADSLFEVLKKGGDFALHAMQFSTDGSAQKGGDLGWFPEGKMVKPFNDSCFASRKNDIKLVKTQFGYHIIQVIDRSPEHKKVQVAILKRNITPSSQTYQHIYSKASRFAGIYNTIDKFKAAAAAEQNLTIHSAMNIKKTGRSLPDLESAREIVRWAFRAEVGEVSIAMETEGYFVVAALQDARKKGIASFEQSIEKIQPIVLKEKKAAIVKNRMAEALRGVSSIEELSEKLQVPVKNADNVSYAAYSISGAGMEPKITAVMASTEKGRLSVPVAGDNSVFVFVIEDIIKPEKPEILIFQQQSMEEEYGARIQYIVADALKNSMKLIDNRAKFF